MVGAKFVIGSLSTLLNCCKLHLSLLIKRLLRLLLGMLKTRVGGGLLRKQKEDARDE